MTQKEVYKNTLLTISLGDELQETYGEIPLEEPMETDGKTLDLYNSRMAIPNSVPGFKEGRRSAHIKDICFLTELGVFS